MGEEVVLRTCSEGLGGGEGSVVIIEGKVGGRDGASV